MALTAPGCVVVGPEHGARPREQHDASVGERGEHPGRPGPGSRGQQAHRAVERRPEQPGARVAHVRDGSPDGVGHAFARPRSEDDRRGPVRVRRGEREPARRPARRCRGPELPVGDVAADVGQPEDAAPGRRDRRDPEAAAGPSLQPTIVRSPNVQRPRVPVSHSRTEPQFAPVAPTAHTTERPVTESAVTGAAFVTVRPGVNTARAAPREDERPREGGDHDEPSHEPNDGPTHVKAA